MPLNWSSLPPNDFDQWTYENARWAVAQCTPKWFAEVRDFLDGDHWRRGKAWVGPHVNPNLDGGDEIMAEVERGHVSANKVDEVVTTHRDAVVGHPVGWHLAPRRFMRPDDQMTTEEQNVRALVEGWLTAWWDRVHGQEHLQDGIYQLLGFSRSMVRHLVPPAAIVADRDPVTGEVLATGVSASDIEQALEFIFLERIDPACGTVFTHPSTQRQISIVLIKQDMEEWAELSYLDSVGNTVFRIVSGSSGTGATARNQRVVTQLGRRLNAYEAVRRRFITQQILENQKALNLSLTMIPRNTVTGGFIERTMFNAQMPGKYVYNEDGSVQQFIPTSYRLGPGSTAWLVGVKTTDAQGNEQVATPTMDRAEPVDPKASITAVGAHERLILSEAKQEHVLTNSDNLMSGKSREQARHRFVGSCRPTKARAEEMTVFILEGALTLAEWFAGVPGLYTDSWRIVARAQIDAGPVGADEREQDLAMVAVGNMSRELQMERAGVLDVDAEVARARTDPEYQLKLWKERFTVLGLAVVAEVPVEVAADLIGIPKADRDKIVKGVEEARQTAIENQPQPNPAAPPATPPVRKTA